MTKDQEWANRIIDAFRGTHPLNDRQWFELADIGKRYGFGAMIQNASYEWVKCGAHTKKNMADWLRGMAEAFDDA